MQCCIPGGGAHDVLVSLITGLQVLLVLLFRFVAGGFLDGQRRTDCTYLRRGTRVLEDAPPPRRWAYRPLAAWWAHAAGCERQAIRLSVSAGAGLLAYGWLTHPVLTVLAACGLGGLAAVITSRRAGARRHQVLPVPQAPSPRVQDAVPADTTGWDGLTDDVLDVMLIAVRRAVPRPADPSAAPAPAGLWARPELRELSDQLGIPQITAGQAGHAMTAQLSGQLTGPGTEAPADASQAMVHALHEGWTRS